MCMDIASATKVADHSTLTNRSTSTILLAGSTPIVDVMDSVPLAFVPPPGNGAKSTVNWKDNPATPARELSSMAHKVLIFPLSIFSLSSLLLLNFTFYLFHFKLLL